MKQASICISPLDWGLGHATRCIPIIDAFKSLGYKIYIASDGNQEAILKQAFPDAHLLSLKGYGVRYTKNKNLLFFSLVLQVPKILVAIAREYFWLKRAHRLHQFDLIVADNRFGFFHKKLPSVFITHQLNLQTPFRWTSNLYQLLLSTWLGKFTACWVPDIIGDHNLSGVLVHPKYKPSIPIWYMGCMSRLQHKLVNENYNTPNVPEAQNKTEIEFLAIVSGPEPQRTLLENQIWDAGNALGLPFVMVAGLPTQQLYNKITAAGELYHHLDASHLVKQIQRAKYIICRGGYTSLMELTPFHKKLILIPTPGQTEQEYLAKYWAENNWAICFDQSKFNLEIAIKQASTHDFNWPDYAQFSTDALASALKNLEKL
jgi:UDP:flavonoid glycosyltransferase YjiC (YdhE family)